MAPKDEIKSDYDLTIKVLAQQEKKVNGEYIAIVKGDAPSVKADYIIKDNDDGTFSYIDENLPYMSLVQHEREWLLGKYDEKNRYVEVLSVKASEEGKMLFTGSLEDIKALIKKSEDKTFDYETWEEKATLSLKNVETSVLSTQKLTRRIDELRKKQDDFITFFKSPEGRAAIAKDLKIEHPIIEDYNENAAKSEVDNRDNEDEERKGKFVKLKGLVMLSDVRIKHPVGIIEKSYAAWDNFLKDNIYKPLGFAGYWDEYLDRKFRREREY
jgi:hypothetical protein